MSMQAFARTINADLFVCDASVFRPRAGAQPAQTIMALATGSLTISPRNYACGCKSTERLGLREVAPSGDAVIAVAHRGTRLSSRRISQLGGNEEWLLCVADSEQRYAVTARHRRDMDG